jgi:hypothetical protein
MLPDVSHEQFIQVFYWILNAAWLLGCGAMGWWIRGKLDDHANR